MEPSRKFTPRREEVLGAIELTVVDQGRPPTLRELGETLGISSTNAVAWHIVRLARDGYLVTERLKARGIVLAGRSRPDVLLKRLVMAVALDPATAQSETIAPVLADCAAYLKRLDDARRLRAMRKSEAERRARENKKYGLKARRKGDPR